MSEKFGGNEVKTTLMTAQSLSTKIDVYVYIAYKHNAGRHRVQTLSLIPS